MNLPFAFLYRHFVTVDNKEHYHKNSAPTIIYYHCLVRYCLVRHLCFSFLEIIIVYEISLVARNTVQSTFAFNIKY